MAYDQPVIFIETNIRTVFIHHFFSGQEKVTDAELVPLLTASLPATNAREWYWALMDYGTFIKQTIGNVSRASHGYAKQSAFEGSRRQIRGQILRFLISGAHPLSALRQSIADDRLESILHDLEKEALIERQGDVYRLCML